MDGKNPLCVTVSLLCKLLEKHMAVAREDLVSASMVAPMYGVILSIRSVWEGETCFSDSPQSWLPYREVVDKVVSLCSEVAKLVSPVVCSSSPEGFLPDSPVSREEDEGVPVQMKSLSPASPRVGTAQSLLLCCWHSMKEIALLLGYLVGHAPVINDIQKYGVLTHTQVMVICMSIDIIH